MQLCEDTKESELINLLYKINSYAYLIDEINFVFYMVSMDPERLGKKLDDTIQKYCATINEFIIKFEEYKSSNNIIPIDLHRCYKLMKDFKKANKI